MISVQSRASSEVPASKVNATILCDQCKIYHYFQQFCKSKIHGFISRFMSRLKHSSMKESNALAAIKLKFNLELSRMRVCLTLQARHRCCCHECHSLCLLYPRHFFAALLSQQPGRPSLECEQLELFVLAGFSSSS